MLILIIILFLINATICASNSTKFYSSKQPANLGAAILSGLVSLMMIAQYLVSGLR